MSRIVILCPGRGSYAEKQLKSLDPADPRVQAAERLRAEFGLPPLLELDGAAKFDRALHLAPENVSPLIWLVSTIDAATALGDHECVGVAGNSLGWYTALAVAGALSFEDGFRVVQTMSLLQKEVCASTGGGQVLYPLVDDEWRRDPEREAAVRSALESSGGEALPSIHLGGLAVLAGSDAGVSHLKRVLPKAKLGSNQYPLQLEQHGPYHTRLVARVSELAFQRLAGVEFRTPDTTLVDGRGRMHSPWSCDLAELRHYTFGAQVFEPYDFGLSVKVALRELAPDQLWCPGPGNTLGGTVGQVVAQEGWRGVRCKADFAVVQEGPAPLLVSMRR